jgi:hypothetical protein
LQFPPEDPAQANLYDRVEELSEDEIQRYFDLFDEVTQS